MKNECDTRLVTSVALKQSALNERTQHKLLAAGAVAVPLFYALYPSKIIVNVGGSVELRNERKSSAISSLQDS